MGVGRGYEQFFGLKERPFGLAPDPRFLFASASHSAALAQIAYAIDRREPIVVVTGEIGTGKTLLCRAVLQRLPRKTFVSVIDDPLLDADDLLKQLLHDFGVISRDRVQVTDARRHELVDALNAFLRSLASLEAHAVVIIDEAQHIQPSVLEQIRLLSNVSDVRGTLLQIILVGQRDMEPLLSRPELRQLQQRVTRRFRLEPLTRDEVQRYVEYRIERARQGAPSLAVPGAAELARAVAEWEGAKPSVAFDADAIETISRISGGVPRLVNLLCDRALEAAFADETRIVDAPTVDAAARALGLTETLDALPIGSPIEPTPERRPTRWLAAAAAVVVIAAIGIGWGAARRRAEVGQPTAEAPPVAAGPAAPAPAQPRVQTPAPPPAALDRTPPPPPQAPPAPTTGDAVAATGTAAAGSGSFEIVVASFRTEARAAEVEQQVSAAGVPARTRTVGTWQQVICGPFVSRDAAEDAQQRLARGGFGGTQIVPSTK